jgi:Bacterial PH domain
MAQKPNKNLDALRSEVPLKPGEHYLGAFLGRTKINWAWFFVIGPLAALTMKQFQVMVTDQRVVFGRLSMMGRLAGIDTFPLAEIEAASFKKGMLTYTITFKFKNGRSLTLDANHKGIVSVEGVVFDPKIEGFLTTAVAR